MLWFFNILLFSTWNLWEKLNYKQRKKSWNCGGFTTLIFRENSSKLKEDEKFSKYKITYTPKDILNSLGNQIQARGFEKCCRRYIQPAAVRSTNLQSFTDDRGCDQLVSWDFFEELVVGRLIEVNQVVQLVPGLSLGPLLLLGFAATASFFLLGGFCQTIEGVINL